MIYVIIPARYQSSRFPGKPLATINGITMIQRVYEQSKQAKLVDDVIVATDDNRIIEAVKAFGGNAIMTSDKHKSGTDRLAEIVSKNNKIEIAVNVQGDEPVIPPECIDMAIKPLIDNSAVSMSTLIRKCNNNRELNNTNIVKVVINKDGDALYFSRSCIPFARYENKIDHYLHIGLYVYRRETLLNISKLPVSELESSEGLEQLRALYNNIKIKTVLTNYNPISVDVPEDIARVEEYLKKSRSPFGG